MGFYSDYRTVLLLLICTILLTVTGRLDLPANTESEKKTPIKIGLLVPRSGVVAENGKQMKQGWELWWDLHGNKVAGLTVKTFVENTGGDPSIGRSKAKRLVEQKGVEVLVGPILANVGLAVADYVEDRNVLLAFPVVADDNITQRDRQWNVLRVAGWSSSQVTHPMGEWAAKQGYSKSITIGSDYNFGHQNVGGFARVFTDNGGRVIKQIWNPLGTNDFSSYLTQVMSYQPDVIFAAEVGSDAVRFVEQWNNFGLKGRVPLVGNPTLLKQSLLKSMGEGAVGLRAVSRYSAARDAPANRKFIRNFDDRYGELPAAEAAAAYTAGKWFSKSFRRLDGSYSNIKELIQAVQAVSVQKSPLGTIRMDQYGNPIIDVYLLETVKRDDGRKWNRVVKTWEQVSQFWKSDPEPFLSQPVYSRSYQGLQRK